MKTRILLLFLIIVALTAISPVAMATTYTWAGGSSGNWAVASNWSPSSGYPGQSGSTDIAIVNTSNCTITLNGTLTIAKLETTGASGYGITISVSSGNTLTITSGVPTVQPSSASNVFTFSGAGITKIGGTISAGYSASFATATGSTVYLTGTAVLDEATGNPHGSFTNAGTLNILSGAQLKFADQAQLVNSGTIQSYSASFTFSGSGSPICEIKNTGTMLDHGSTMTFTGQSDAFLNSGTTSSATMHGTTITFSAGSNNQNITNAGTFTIDSAATINVGTYTAYVSNTGTFYAGTSNSACTINLTAQSANVTNNSGGAFYLGDVSVITFGGYQANVTNNSGGTFTIQSDANGSGAIGALSNSATVSGSYNVQRYLQGGYSYERNWRLLSSPVYAAYIGSAYYVYGINYLQNSIYLTGTTLAAGGFDVGPSTTSENPTLYLYRENLTPAFTTFLNSNYIGISKINNSPTYAYSMNDATYTGTYNIPTGSGYLCFFRGDRSTTFAYKTTSPFPIPENTTLTATGSINTGTIVMRNWFNPTATTLSFTAATPTPYQGCNLAGNPYPCTIDWETYQSTNTGVGIYGKAISSTIYELNPTNHHYDTYQKGGSSTGSATRYIVSGQGFIVTASGTSSGLTFYETAKVPTAQNISTNLFMGTPDQQTVSSQHLKLQVAMDSINNDDTYIGFNSKASGRYNDTTDARYMISDGAVSISSLSSDNVSSAIKVQPLPKRSERIGLWVSAQADGIYSLNMKEIQGIPQLYDIWLMDAYKNDSLDMRHNKTYQFNLYTADTNSYGSKRFSLVIRENPAYAYRLLSFAASKVNSSQRQVQITWKTENEENYTNFAVQRSTDGGKTYTVVGSLTGSDQGTYSLVDKSPGDNNLYRLQSQDVDNNITYSNIVTIGYSNLGSNLAQGNINVYPNPVASTINLTIAAPVNFTGKYNILITNSSGIVVQQASSASPTWQSDANNLQPGTYVIRVLNAADQTEIGSTKFVKM